MLQTSGRGSADGSGVVALTNSLVVSLTPSTSVLVVVTTDGGGSDASLVLKNSISDGTLPASIQRKLALRTRSMRSNAPSPIHVVISAKSVW